MSRDDNQDVLRPFAAQIKLLDQDLQRLIEKLVADREVVDRLPDPVTLSSVEEQGARIVATFVPPLRHSMTSRQREIALLVGNGLGNAGIARTLKISRNTVKNHLKQLYHEFGFPSRAALARYAIVALYDPVIVPRDKEN